jgi:hypothetical protein
MNWKEFSNFDASVYPEMELKVKLDIAFFLGEKIAVR